MSPERALYERDPEGPRWAAQSPALASNPAGGRQGYPSGPLKTAVFGGDGCGSASRDYLPCRSSEVGQGSGTERGMCPTAPVVPQGLPQPGISRGSQ